MVPTCHIVLLAFVVSLFVTTDAHRSPLQHANSTQHDIFDKDDERGTARTSWSTYRTTTTTPVLGGIFTQNNNNKTPFSIPIKVVGDRRSIYVAPIYIGTPEDGKLIDNDPFYIVFDTTSSNSWVYGEVFDEEEGEGGSKRPSKRGKRNEDEDSDDEEEEEDDDEVFFDEEHCSGTKKERAMKEKERSKEDIENGVFLPTGRCDLRNYDSRSSTTYKPHRIEEDLKDGYVFYDGDDNYDGDLAVDTMKIGPKAVKSVKFLVVDKLIGEEANEHGVAGLADGVIGLNTDRNLHFPGTAVFPRMGAKKGGALKAPAVALYISPSGSTGEIMFGGHNKKYLASGTKMKYFKPIPAQQFVPEWTLRFNSLRLGKRGTPIVQKFKAVIASTVSHAFETSSWDQFESLPTFFKHGSEILTDNDDPMFEDNPMLVIDCDERTELPELELVILKKVFSFTGQEVFPREIINNDRLEGKCASFFGFDDTPNNSKGAPHAPSPHQGNNDQKKNDKNNNKKEAGGGGETVQLLAKKNSKKKKTGGAATKAAIDKEDEWKLGMDFIKKYYVEFRLRGKFMNAPYIGIGLSSGIELVHDTEEDEEGEEEEEEDDEEEEEEDEAPCVEVIDGISGDVVCGEGTGGGGDSDSGDEDDDA